MLITNKHVKVDTFKINVSGNYAERALNYKQLVAIYSNYN